MNVRRIGSCALVLVAVGSTGLGTLAVERASAATSGPCPSTDGVTVVVDFGSLGGGVVVRCAPGPQANGHAALVNAGFSWAGTTRFATFVCRIDNKPGPDADRCYDASPPNATWSYWSASAGGDWKYSNVGAAAGSTAAPGTVQGWSWSTGSQPRQPSISAPMITPTTAPPTRPVAPTPPAPAPAPPASSPAPAPGDGGAGQAIPNPGAPAAGAPNTTPPAPPHQRSTASPGATPTHDDYDAAVPAPNPDPGEAVEAGDTTTTTPEVAVEGETSVVTTTSPGRDVAVAETVEIKPVAPSVPVGTIAGAGIVAAGAVVAGVLERRRRVGRGERPSSPLN